MPDMVLLVGLPGSGKTTYIDRLINAGIITDNVHIASTDNIIDGMCNQNDLTYSEGFDKFIKPATSKFNNDLKAAFNRGDDIYVDRTNLTSKGRAKFIRMAKNSKHDYRCIAVVFHVDDDVLSERLDDRCKYTGKCISNSVIETMKNSYIAPHVDEGFDLVLGDTI